MTFKIAYDTTNAFWNYRKLKSATRLQDVWNEAIIGAFVLATKDPDVQKYFGAPVKMGPPPLQSKSPLLLTQEGFVTGIILGPLSVLRKIGKDSTVIPAPINMAGAHVASAEVIYNEDRDRATVIVPPKRKTPELPAHIPASIRASLATKGEPIVVPNAPTPTSSPNMLPLINIPAFRSYMEVELPLVGTRSKGVLNVLVFSEKKSVGSEIRSSSG